MWAVDGNDSIHFTHGRVYNNIREAVRKSGKSQGQVAREMGVTQGAVSRWCSGGFCPAVDTLVILARVLHVPFAELVKGLIDDSSAKG